MANQEFPKQVRVLYTLDAITQHNLCSLPNATQNYLVQNVHMHKQNLCTIYVNEIYVNENMDELHGKETLMGIKVIVTIQILPTGTKGFMLIFTHWYIYLDILWD